MPFDGTVEWVLAHATEARDLLEAQRELLRAYHVRLAESQDGAPPEGRRAPRWKKVLS